MQRLRKMHYAWFRNATHSICGTPVALFDVPDEMKPSLKRCRRCERMIRAMDRKDAIAGMMWAHARFLAQIERTRDVRNSR